MFDKLKTIFKGKEGPKSKAAPQPEAKATKQPAAAPAKVEEKQSAKNDKKAVQGKPAAPAPPKKVQTPEEMCGITGKMAKDEVRERLALLYKRYNRATSSLDATLRAEAEEMLDAIVVIREKVFGPI